MEIRWVTGEVEGRIGVVTPYNATFVQELKRIVPGARFARDRTAWLFDEEVKNQVVALVQKFFCGGRQWTRLAWHRLNAADITIDGASLVWVNRDYWRWRTDHGLELRVVECTLESGGSRKYPVVAGALVLEVALREEAVIYPEPDEVEPLDEEPIVANPLAAYSTEDLLAELRRRSSVEVKSGSS